jgi:glutathione-independent formaldehyde dehydrogenase
LQKAREIGAEPINFTQRSAAEQIVEQGAEFNGADKGVDAVGYQAHSYRGDRDEPAVVLNSLIETVCATGIREALQHAGARPDHRRQCEAELRGVVPP